MLIEYVNKAMSKAAYEKIRRWYLFWKDSTMPWRYCLGETLYQCQEELRSVLEGWLIVKIRHGDRLPVIGGINLNNKMPAQKEIVAHG